MTPRRRRVLVDVLVVGGWSAAAAERFQVDAKRVREWRDRYFAESGDGLVDRSSRPHNSPARTPEATRRRIVELRTQRCRGAAWIAHHVGVAPSTVQNILNSEGLGHLDVGGRAPQAPPVR